MYPGDGNDYAGNTSAPAFFNITAVKPAVTAGIAASFVYNGTAPSAGATVTGLGGKALAAAGRHLHLVQRQ